MQAFEKITQYPYGTYAFIVCESEMLSKYKLLILMIIQMKKKTEHNPKGPYILDHPYRI